MSIKNIVVTANLSTSLNVNSVLNALLERGVKCWKNFAFGSINIRLEKGLLFQLFPSGRVISAGGNYRRTSQENFHATSENSFKLRCMH